MTGEKNVSATGVYVNLDFVEYGDIVRVENTDSSITYNGAWGTHTYSYESGGIINNSNTTGDYVEYTFTGSRVLVGIEKAW